jgi:hypothetical protein
MTLTDPAPAGRLVATGPGSKAAQGRPDRFVAPAERATRAPVVGLPVGLADVVLVGEGDRVLIGQPLIERARDTILLEVAAASGLETLAPGDPVDTAVLPSTRAVGRQGVRAGDLARLLYVGHDGIARVAVGREPSTLTSPVDGTVERVEPGRLTLRARGLGMRGRVGWGQAVSGRLVLGVAGPDAELRASAIDIGAAGSILVAGARLDIEALTRARAIGVAGVIAGGLVGRELHQLEEADLRQRAALHAAGPFGVVVMDGFGRRPMPALAWELLVAAEGRQVGLAPDERLVIVDGEEGLEPPRVPQGTVRITAGDGAGRTGRIVGLAGPVRTPAGLYQPAGWVELPAAGDEPPRRRLVPLADLERLD